MQSSPWLGLWLQKHLPPNLLLSLLLRLCPRYRSEVPRMSTLATLLPLLRKMMPLPSSHTLNLFLFQSMRRELLPLRSRQPTRSISLTALLLRHSERSLATTPSRLLEKVIETKSRTHLITTMLPSP